MLKNNAKAIFVINSAVLASGLQGAVGVHAQEGVGTLEEIVVTASRREQSIQRFRFIPPAFAGLTIPILDLICVTHIAPTLEIPVRSYVLPCQQPD